MSAMKATRDAVCTGLVFDLKKYSIHDGPGIRTAVHLKGCPLDCWWCHNPEGISPLPELLFRKERCVGCGACEAVCEHAFDFDRCTGCGACVAVCAYEARTLCGTRMTVDELLTELEKDRIFYDESGGGVTLTGGEPLLQPEFARDVLSRCRSVEIGTVVDTCGFVARGALLDCVPDTDLFLYDLKHMDPQKHRFYTGVDNAVILENLLALGQAGARINLRVPFMPGLNDDAENLIATARFANRVQGATGINLLPYHSAAKMKHERARRDYRLTELLVPTPEALEEAAAIVREHTDLPVRIGG